MWSAGRSRMTRGPAALTRRRLELGEPLQLLGERDLHPEDGKVLPVHLFCKRVPERVLILGVGHAEQLLLERPPAGARGVVAAEPVGMRRLPSGTGRLPARHL